MNGDTTRDAMNEAAARANAWADKNRAEGGVCDFCCHLLGDGPVVTYVSKPWSDTLVGFASDGVGVLEHVQDPYWGACPACDEVIQKRDAATLADHVVATTDYDRVGVRSDPVILRAELRRMYEQFFAGDPRRVEGRPDECDLYKVLVEDVAFEEHVKGYQELIDTGLAWRLEGSAGREAMRLIEDGYCTLGPEAHTDYYGNRVPARDEVEPGTRGSPEYVAARQEREA